MNFTNLGYAEHIALNDMKDEIFLSTINSTDSYYIMKMSGDGKLLNNWTFVEPEENRAPFSISPQSFQPNDIAVDSEGNVYVTAVNLGVLKFSNDGKFIKQWGSMGLLMQERTQNKPTDDMLDAGGIAVDSTGNVYVSDWTADEIKKFSPDGKFLTKWGSYGTNDGELNMNHGHLSIDSTGNIYVVDDGNSRIQKFSPDGKFLTKWGSQGNGDGEFDQPGDIALDSQKGVLFVTEFANQRIQKFNTDGKFLTKFAEFEVLSDVAVNTNTGLVYVTDGRGDSDHPVRVFAPISALNATTSSVQNNSSPS